MNLAIKPFIWLLVLGTFAWSFPSAAVESDPSCRAAVHEDGTKVLSIDSAKSLFKQDPNAFHVKNFKDLSFGFSKSVFWLFLQCENPNTNEIQIFAEFKYPLLDRIDVFDLQQSAPIFQLGDQSPRKNRPVDFRNAILPIKIGPNSTVDYFIAIESKGSVQFPIEIHSSQGFIQHVDRENLWFGVFYGTLMAMLFYNFFLFISLRDRSYFYYICYLLTYIPLQMAFDGKASQLIWPESFWLANNSIAILLPFSLFFIFSFSRSFLVTRNFLPRIDRLLKCIQVYFLVWTLLGVFAPYHLTTLVGTLSAIVSVPVILLIGILSIRANYVPARFFTAAWLAFLVGILLLNVKNLGYLPPNFVFNHAIQIGSILESILLSLAMGYRIKTVEVEMRKSESLRFAAETEKQRLKDLTNLAEQVAHDIRSPLSAINAAMAILEKAPSDGRKLVESATIRINGIANDLLARYRVQESDAAVISQSGSQKSISQPFASFNLNDTLEQIVNEKRALFSANSKIQIHLDLRGKEEMTTIDPKQISRVLSNLINNSVEAIEETGTVTVALRPTSKSVSIIVSDTGRGIEDNLLKKLGHEKISVGKSGVESGSGIGVFYAKSIIEQMKGTFLIQSRVGMGTTVTITFPRS